MRPTRPQALKPLHLVHDGRGRPHLLDAENLAQAAIDDPRRQEHPALLAGQRSAYAAAGEPKSLLEVDGHHYSVYTDWKDVTTAAARDWFLEHLTSSKDNEAQPNTTSTNR